MLKSLLISAAITLSVTPVSEAHNYNVCFQWDSIEPCVSMPLEMALAAPVVIQCESNWDKNAIGWAGERGLLQIHPIHMNTMDERGLNFFEERDRLMYAIEIWEYAGWRPWSCKP